VIAEENDEGTTEGDSSHYNSSSDYSTDTELEISPVSQCPVCNLSINTRNSEIERIAVIFNKMMGHRMKM